MVNGQAAAANARETADRDRFAAETGGFRRELLAHCYRMAGSALRGFRPAVASRPYRALISRAENDQKKTATSEAPAKDAAPGRERIGMW